MLQHRYSITWACAAAIHLFAISGCADAVAPSVPRRDASPLVPDEPLFSEYPESDGFYPADDGYHYWWDGTPPEGDEGPSVIHKAWATATAPYWGYRGGSVKGTMRWTGDEAKLDVTYNVTRNGTPVYTNAQTSSDWQYCWQESTFGVRCNSATHTHEKRFSELSDECDVAVSAGGTAYARKALPFGLKLEVKVWLLEFAIPGQKWGFTELGLEPGSDPGVKCESPRPWSPCDDPNTPELELCPPVGDEPRDGDGHDPTDYQGDDDGYEQPGEPRYWCTYTDWYVSWHNGAPGTWYWERREYHGCFQY